MPPSPPLPKLIKLSLVRTYVKITSAPFTMHVMKSHSIDFNFNLNFNRVGMSQGLAQCYEKPINVFTYVQFRRLFYVSPRNDSFSSVFFCCFDGISCILYSEFIRAVWHRSSKLTHNTSRKEMSRMWCNELWPDLKFYHLNLIPFLTK